MQTTTVTSAGVPLYEAKPDAATAAVVLIQEAYGVNDHIADVARRLAAAGYHTVAPHLFHRDGVNTLPYDFETAKPHLDNLTSEDLLADVGASLDYLVAQGFLPPSVGILGFCMGGSVALLAASAPAFQDGRAFGAAVTFYGGGVSQPRFGMPALLDVAAGLASPWLGLFGDRDPGIPVDDVEQLRDVVTNAPVPTSIVRYPEAGHAFHCDARPSNYHEASATDAWSKTLDWFGRYLHPAR
jgi:carboxymethylenebutenolidase